MPRGLGYVPVCRHPARLRRRLLLANHSEASWCYDCGALQMTKGGKWDSPIDAISIPVDALLQRRTIAELVREVADRIERGEFVAVCIATALGNGLVQSQIGGSDEDVKKCIAALLQSVDVDSN